MKDRDILDYKSMARGRYGVIEIREILCSNLDEICHTRTMLKLRLNEWESIWFPYNPQDDFQGTL